MLIKHKPKHFCGTENIYLGSECRSTHSHATVQSSGTHCPIIGAMSHSQLLSTFGLPKWAWA